MLEQRAKLAEFGPLAVEGADLDEPLQQAAVGAARSLHVSYSRALQYLPEEKSVLVRAGAGWGEGVVGRGAPRDPGKEARLTLEFPIRVA